MKVSHIIRYRYVCEACDVQTKWMEMKVEGETSGVVGSAAGRYLAQDELRAKLKGLKKRADEGDYGLLEGGAACPACKARQSWMPVHDVTQLSPSARFFLTVLGFFCAGLVVALIALLVLDAKTGFTYEAPQYVPLVMGVPILGFTAWGLWRGYVTKKRRAQENALQQAAVTVRHVPEINWNGAEKLFEEKG